ncbi:MAG: hypothetical protein HYX21_00980 [Candidatus Yanofskybacteria bacterium]|nr:hypothetical protein [Candidatus Yanofskybacteria bacterium]
MREGIHRKVINKEPGLYISLVFPIAFAFLVTFTVSRIFSHFFPQFYIQWAPGLRVHHYAYGFFVLAAAGYLALVFNGPGAKYGAALLFGLGLGLAFDEFGMWLKLRDDEPTRWSYDGFNIVIGFFFLLLSAKQGMRLLLKLGLFKRN